MAAAGGAWWFQVYLMHDLDITIGLVRRAVAAGAQALVLTGDTPFVGRKARIADAPISDGRLPGQHRPAGRPGRH